MITTSAAPAPRTRKPKASRNPAITILAVGAAAILTGCQDVLGNRTGSAPEPRVIWRVASGPSENATPHDPAANADRTMVYFLTTDYRLKKIRGSDGLVIWDVDAGPVLMTVPAWNVALSGGHVVVEKIDLFGFDTTTGAARWSYTAPGGDPTGYSAIVSDDSTVYAASHGGRMYAIDARTGEARWITDLTEGRPDVGALFPVIAGGSIYVCTRSVASPIRGTLWAIDAATGSVRWRYDFQPELEQQYAVCYGDAAIWNDLVIMPQSDGRVFAFEAATGNVRWIAPRVHPLPSRNGPGGTWTGSWVDARWAAAFGDHLVVTSMHGRGLLVAYDPATGAERWRNDDIAGVHLSHPVLDETSVYLGYGSLYAAFDLATGRLRWRTPSTDLGRATPLQGKPVIATDRIFLGGRDGSYAVAK